MLFWKKSSVFCKKTVKIGTQGCFLYLSGDKFCVSTLNLSNSARA